MCAACHEHEGVVEYSGDLLCSRCGVLREWAFVISMIQDRITGPGRPASHQAVTVAEVDVAADPFAAA